MDSPIHVRRQRNAIGTQEPAPRLPDQDAFTRAKCRTRSYVKRQFRCRTRLGSLQGGGRSSLSRLERIHSDCRTLRNFA
jgi:tRNA A37 N6-isopentenylltransferase MiaA